jgi:protein-tyrosine phosphatase
VIPRWIDLEGAANARVVVPSVLLRSDNLQSLSEQDVRVLTQEHGVEVVLDLRTDVEVDLEGPGPMTRAPGVRIEHRSLYPDSGGNTDVELNPLKPWQRLRDEDPADEPPPVRAYLSYLRRRPDSVVGSIRTIARAERGVLVHCAAGKDRTGVVVALALDAAGFDRQAIVGDYVASSERIEAITERLRGSPTYSTELAGVDPAQLAPVSNTIERFFHFVEAGWGSSSEWLAAQGLEPADLKRLQERLSSGAAAAAA